MHSKIGLDIVKLRGKWTVFDSAMTRLAKAQNEYLDTELGGLLSRWKMKAEGLSLGGPAS
jgi:hypothetical protein